MTKKALLYCNVDTLVNCSKEQLEKTLNESFSSVTQIDDRLWYVVAYPDEIGFGTGAIEDSFYRAFNPISNENSIIVLTELGRNSMYELPDSAVEFFNS